jgi:spore germination protein YaaH
MALTGLPLSMDFTVPEGSDQWSKVYDRQTLAGYLDYFILMAYDEFWASSDISGPVASLPWTLEGVLKTLELVPTEKLILGIPGYMRVWEDTGGGNTSNVLSIKNRDSYLEERNFEITYLEDLSMNYASRREGNTLYRIWLEDETAIGRRLEIVKDFNLPGIALWRRNFIDEQTEQFIEENLD